MKRFLLILCFFVFQLAAKANSILLYKKSKNGITLFATVGASKNDSLRQSRVFDAFLDQLVKKLNRPRDGPPVYLLIDQFDLFRKRKDWFATLAYDKLTEPDPVFINDYFETKAGGYENVSTRNQLGTLKNLFDSIEPIDLGSVYDYSKAPLGLRIMYDYGETDSLTCWDRLYTLAQYGLDKLEEIKRKQKRILLPYPYFIRTPPERMVKVSVLTIDTTQIKNLPLLVSGFNPKQVNNGIALSTFIFSGILLIAGAIILLQWKKRRSS